MFQSHLHLPFPSRSAIHRWTGFFCICLGSGLLTACGSGKAEQEVPSLTEIEGMTNDEAAEALSGFCRQDILDAWGKPGGGLSGLFGKKK